MARIQESLSVAHKTGAPAARDLGRVVVDATVQPKASRIRPIRGCAIAPWENWAVAAGYWRVRQSCLDHGRALYACPPVQARPARAQVSAHPARPRDPRRPPHDRHRTGLADCPHPALGQDFTFSPTTGHDQAGQAYEAKVLVKVREWISSALASSIRQSLRRQRYRLTKRLALLWLTWPKIAWVHRKTTQLPRRHRGRHLLLQAHLRRGTLVQGTDTWSKMLHQNLGLWHN